MKPEIKQHLINIVAFATVSFVVFWFIMLVWNWVMPQLGIPRVSFIQIIAICVIFNLLRLDWFVIATKVLNYKRDD